MNAKNNLNYLFKCLLICCFWYQISCEIIEVVEKISEEVKGDYIVISETDLISNRPIHGKWGDDKDLYMAQCTTDENCNAAYRLICKSGHCVCNPGDLFFDWPKYGCFSKVHMFGQCEVSGQCLAYTPNTFCNPDNSRCTCSPNFFFNGRDCILRYDGSNLKAQEVYKAAVVAAACFIVAVVGIFVACIVRRSFCRREPNLPPSESNRNSDIFSISDEIAAMRAVDKPPSYEEVLQIERTFYGIPPPEYSASRNVNNATYQASSHFPTSQRILPLPYLSDCIPPRPSMETGNLPTTSAEHNKEPESGCPETSTSSNIIAAAEVLPPPEGSGASAYIAASPNWGYSHLEPSTSRSYICEECTKTSAASSACEKCKANLERASADFSIDSPGIAAGVYTLQSQIPSEAGILDDLPSTCVQPTPIRVGRLATFTPPPNPRRAHVQTPSHASSLPGSPHLSSHSSAINLPLLKELLKFESQRFDSPVASTSRNDSPSNSSHQRSTVAGDSSGTIAYDNLGFVPDFHV